jgi:hypothetical protein
MKTIPKLSITTLAALFARNFQERHHLLTPWLRQGESALIWSAPGVGKSMLSLSLALAVGGGGSCLGWQSPAPRKVLLVDGEQHIQDIHDRAKMLMQTIEGIDAGEAGKNVTILARQDQDPCSEFPDLAEEEGRDKIFRRAMSSKIDMIILDNFSTLATVEDENAASAFNPIITFLLQMKQAGIATILVHHSNKTGKDFRGSSKLATTFEVILGLQRPTSNEHKFGTAFDLEWTKYRQKREDTLRGRSVWLEEDPDGAISWKYELSQDEEGIELVALVRSCKFTTQAELATEMGVSTGKLSPLKWRAINGQRLISTSEWDDCLKTARDVREDEGNIYADDDSDF